MADLTWGVGGNALAQRRKQRDRVAADGEMTSKNPFWQIVAAAGLATNLLLIGMSLWGALFGPRGFILFGAAGFLVGWLCIASGSSSKRIKSWPALLKGTACEVAYQGFERLVGAAAVLAVLSVLLMFGASRLGGVGDFPALERLPKYEFNNHGTRTEVSRTRYVLSGAAFAVGWHSMAALMSLGGLCHLLCGKPPTMFQKSGKNRRR